jgi:hypothetical protein
MVGRISCLAELVRARIMLNRCKVRADAGYAGEEGKGRIMRTEKKIMVVMALLLAAALPATAATINYGDFGGGPGQVTFASVTESSITDTLPLFGAPTAIDNSLFFFPNSFASSSSNGSADTTAGTVSMTITASNGGVIPGILISEVGDYSLLGPDAQASVLGLLTVTDLVHGTVLFDSLAVLPGTNGVFSTGNGDTNGLWTGIVFVPLLVPTSSVEVLFNNDLQTSAGLQSSAFIQKKPISLEITVPTPEPATMALLAAGGLVAVIRRRRK